ncbi:unnamed protein product [Rangifer tarandus platyrhynchus]|uniref:Uncharacterized protein n=1 Tax=Rangifer tarandus platyrhynchus TaxID=3082113 RepID=A0ABN8ZSW7_RANTA|nr:unnamed protein product [Rangifer tarandus platyrhynchus]
MSPQTLGFSRVFRLVLLKWTESADAGETLEYWPRRLFLASPGWALGVLGWPGPYHCRGQGVLGADEASTGQCLGQRGILAGSCCLSSRGGPSPMLASAS